MHTASEVVYYQQHPDKYATFNRPVDDSCDLLNQSASLLSLCTLHIFLFHFKFIQILSYFTHSVFKSTYISLSGL